MSDNFLGFLEFSFNGKYFSMFFNSFNDFSFTQRLHLARAMELFRKRLSNFSRASSNCWKDGRYPDRRESCLMFALSTPVNPKYSKSFRSPSFETLNGMETDPPSRIKSRMYLNRSPSLSTKIDSVDSWSCHISEAIRVNMQSGNCSSNDRDTS